MPAQSREELSLFDWLLWRYHYLPYSGATGENIKYLVFDCRARPLACLLYGAAGVAVMIAFANCACRSKTFMCGRCARTFANV